MPTSILKDTQNLPDDRNLPIDRVGIKNLRYPVQIHDKDGSAQNTIATAQLTVDLPHQFKGTHMSRFVEVLNSHGPSLHVENIHEILHQLIDRLDSQKAHLVIEFPFFLSKAAPVTGAKAMIDYGVKFDATATAHDIDFVVEVQVPVTTLCPCSKEISKHGAHNQRGLVTFAVRFTKPVWIEDLIQLVESCASSELYALLKRPDEKAVTERAYENPVFVEDLVRAVASLAQAHPDITAFKVEAENFESIHNHNAYALIESAWQTT